MNLNITGHHLDVTPAIRAYIHTKMSRVVRHFDHVIDASAFLMVDRAKEKDLRQTAELTLHLKGKELFAQAHHEDLYHAMDAVIDKLDRQLLKHKEIIQDRHHDKNKVQSLSQ